jgi:hypothetical protein
LISLGIKQVHNVKLHSLYFSQNTTGAIKSGTTVRTGVVASTGKKRGAYRVLVEKPEGKRPFGRHRHRWECNIK